MITDCFLATTKLYTRTCSILALAGTVAFFLAEMYTAFQFLPAGEAASYFGE